MAGLWIEAHQAVARHPKIKRGARQLGIDRITMIGHVLCMWWWAVDYAPDGTIDPDDLDELCDDIDWPHAPDKFVAALTDVGLLERTDGGWAIHDWHKHGGKATLQARELAAERGRYGAHQRYHVKAGDPRAGCRWCQGDPAPVDPSNPPARPPIGEGMGEPSRPPIGKTGQDRTGQDRTDKPLASSGDDADAEPAALELVTPPPPTPPPIDVATLIDVYPRRDGKPWGGGPRREVDRAWKRLTAAEQRAAAAAMPQYAEYTARAGTPNPAYLSTWLNQRRWEDWQTPAAPPSAAAGNGVNGGRTFLTANEQRSQRSREARAAALAEFEQMGLP